ncbi:hypothetical protein ACJW30_12G174000 [Castanea mollissima]
MEREFYKLTWVAMVVPPKFLYFERNSSFSQYISIVEVTTNRQYFIHIDITLKTKLQKPRNVIYNDLKYNQVIFNFKAAIAFVYQLPKSFFPLFFLFVANKNKLHIKKKQTWEQNNRPI